MRVTNFWWAAAGILLVSLGLTNSSCMVTRCSKRAQLCNSKQNFEEVYRENCTIVGRGRGEGAAAYCCTTGSMEATLAATLGAEPHEFPYMGRLDMDGGMCGATIYNENYLITAAHCIIDDSTNNVTRLNRRTVVKLGRNIEDSPIPENMYRIVEAIPHPQYSGLVGHPELLKGDDAQLFNDIALLRVDRAITFGPNVKAISIAPEGFDEMEYADNAIILGWGKNDIRAQSGHLQKANAILRSDETCFNGEDALYGSYAELSSQLIFLGGHVDGKWSPTADSGDSGGPAICRGDNDGTPVLCGVASLADTECGDTKEECGATIYVEVDHFRDWIELVAGEQREEDFFTGKIYGEGIQAKDYPHQVHITSAWGDSCGGTLIASDTVVTTARCVKDPNELSGDSHEYIEVWVGVQDILNGKLEGTTILVKSVSIREGFEVIGPSLEVIQNQDERVTYTDQLHKNDLAVLKLEEKADVSKSQLPRLPKNGETFRGHGVAVEFAFPRDTSKGGDIRKRDFTILDKGQCQRRMNRLRNLGKNVKIDGNTLCGVEVHSGGSQCDRELGGGLICKGEDGKDVLCGVQKFRMCESALPSAFENVGTAVDFIQNAGK